MTPLLVASLIWAFSFGLIKGRLAGLDPTAVAVLRLAVSLAVFLPFFRPAGLGIGRMSRLALIGAVQFGAMYLLYLRSYADLQAYEVALFTITTPAFVALLDSWSERRLRLRYLLAAGLSVAGAALVVWHALGGTGALRGFLLVQASNLCFAAGQVAWRRERARGPADRSEAAVFALPFAGALAISLGTSAVTTRWSGFAPSPSQWATIVYLGAAASGLGFFLWNLGARRVNAGVLSAFNNAKIPLGIACSLLFFGERADLGRLIAGGALMAAGVWVARSGGPGTYAEPRSARAAA